MSAPPLDAAAREAIDWMVQLHSGEASARDRQAFEAWLRRDARHEPIRPMPTLPSHPSALRRGLRPLPRMPSPALTRPSAPATFRRRRSAQA